MTNKPMERFTQAVEEALRASSYSMMTPIGRDAALASIQAATADLLLELVGEDLKPKNNEAVKGVKLVVAGRNTEKAIIRKAAADLRAEGGGEQ